MGGAKATAHQESVTKDDSYDSLIGQQHTGREYLIYDEAQCYPEYIMYPLPFIYFQIWVGLSFILVVVYIRQSGSHVLCCMDYITAPLHGLDFEIQ